MTQRHSIIWLLNWNNTKFIYSQLHSLSIVVHHSIKRYSKRTVVFIVRINIMHTPKRTSIVHQGDIISCIRPHHHKHRTILYTHTTITQHAHNQCPPHSFHSHPKTAVKNKTKRKEKHQKYIAETITQISTTSMQDEKIKYTITRRTTVQKTVYVILPISIRTHMLTQKYMPAFGTACNARNNQPRYNMHAHAQKMNANKNKNKTCTRFGLANVCQQTKNETKNTATPNYTYQSHSHTHTHEHSPQPRRYEAH